MNDKLLLQKRVSIPQQYINFLNFIHPDFEFVENLDNYDNPNPRGIIYVGSYSDKVIEKLNTITKKWIIVNNNHFDYDLTTSDGLLKHILPIHYTKLKNSKNNELSVYIKMNYGTLLDKIKQCLIANIDLSADDEITQSVYSLYTAILGTTDVLNYTYFNTVTKENVSRITSAVLTFLVKVQTKNIKSEQVYYSRLIMQSHKRYGKYIKSAINQFVKSKANRMVALHQLLLTLNKAR